MWAAFGLALLLAASASATFSGSHSRQRDSASGEVRAACDAAQAIAEKVPGVSVRRRTGAFQDESLPKPVLGCEVAVSGSFRRAGDGGDVASRLRDAFPAEGWNEMAAYSADGPDGTSFAFRKGRVSCLVRGRWNGGAAGQAPVAGEDAYRVAVICTSPVFRERR